MQSLETRLVDITREFLLATQALRRLVARYRTGELRFEELPEFIGDSEASVMFRLKESCHALFRGEGRGGDLATLRGGLFDLAVGSLFHEAMKLRESFYQLASYRPKVQALRAEAGPDADRLFEEFERILAAAESRVREAFQEAQQLLGETRTLFVGLLTAHPRNGLVARYLIENRSLVEEVFEEPLDAFLERIYRSPAEGYVLAAHSYLCSGYFEEALRALEEALRREPGRPELERLVAYAEGMRAYLEGRYVESIDRLGRWLELGPGGEERCLVPLARSALDRVGALVEDGDEREVTKRASALTDRLAALAPDGGRRDQPSAGSGRLR